MSNFPKHDNARGQAGRVRTAKTSNPIPTPPIVAGQRAQVFSVIQQYQPLMSLRLTADYGIHEAASRAHDLRVMGFNILTSVRPTLAFRGIARRNVASHSLGTPDWPRPGFFENEEMSK